MALTPLCIDDRTFPSYDSHLSSHYQTHSGTNALGLHNMSAQPQPGSAYVPVHDLVLPLSLAIPYPLGTPAAHRRTPVATSSLLSSPAILPATSRLSLLVAGRWTTTAIPSTISGIVTVSDVLRATRHCLHEQLSHEELRSISREDRSRIHAHAVRRVQANALQSPEILRVDALMNGLRLGEVTLRNGGDEERVWLEVWFV